MDSDKFIDRLLIFLVVLDIGYFVAAFFFSDVWSTLFHGQIYPDALGLLKRTSAIWATFVIFQTIALLFWRKNHLWLAVVAGMRLTEMCCDWVYALSAVQLTWFGWFALLCTPLSNIWLGYVLLNKASQLFKDQVIHEKINS